VDAEGPLARLKNLLFNKETLLTVAQWITVSWRSLAFILSSCFSILFKYTDVKYVESFKICRRRMEKLSWMNCFVVKERAYVLGSLSAMEGLCVM
jgi:hypothetical protein